MDPVQQFRPAAVTKDGRSWHPSYLIEIDQEKCIGCGRCYKVCGRSVMSLMGITDEGEIVSLEDDEDVERKIMAISDGGSCIGCGACARVCPKNCQKFGVA